MLYYEVYEKCRLQDLTIALGRSVISYSGFLNSAVQFVVQILNWVDTSSSTNEFNLIAGYKTDYDNGVTTLATACLNTGIILGQMTTNLFNIQVQSATKEYSY